MARTDPQVWLLLRGLCRGAFHWNDFPLRLRESQPGAVILTPDLPGNGERWNETSPASIAAMVEAYREWLPAPQHPLRVIALSMGGMVGLQWMQSYPAEIAQLVLVNTSSANLVPLYQRLNPVAAARLFWGTLGGDRSREREVLALTSVRHAHDRQLARTWADYARTHPVAWRNGLRQMAAAARYRCSLPFPRELAERVLVVNSAGDRLVSPAASRRLADTLGCPLVTHPIAGHDLPLDDGGWLIDQLPP